MANDREVLKEVWEGKIPAKFIVDSEDIEADVFFVLLPRVSYLSLTIEKIKKHFQRYIEKEDEIWFSYNSIPLKFHIPIGEFPTNIKLELHKPKSLTVLGVLYDLIVSENILPWQVNVHFNKFPEEYLFKFPNK